MMDGWVGGWIVRGLRLSTGRGRRIVVCRSIPWGDCMEVGVHSIGTGKQARWVGSNW